MEAVRVSPPSGRLPGGWIADGIGLRLCITLCDTCDRKFVPRKCGYELWRRDLGLTGPYVLSDCWGCSSKWVKCKAFIHESLHDVVGDDTPRRGRWGRKETV